MNLIKPLVDRNDPILKTPAEPFDFDNPQMDPIELAHTLAQTMIHNAGLGLAAPQIGLPYRVCIINTNPLICMFNPRIVETSIEQVKLEEGCLTFPGVILSINRPKIIRVRYTLPNGETDTHQYIGMTARIIQHEVSHLDGRLFYEDVTPFVLKRAIIKANKSYGQSYSMADFRYKEIT